jgi:phenylalanyl-tRNA synthetase beta chain
MGWGWPSYEPLRIGAIMYGSRTGRTWTNKDAPVDFYDAKGAIEAALTALRIEGAIYAPGSEPYLHPRASAAVLIEKTPVGSVGILHPRIARQLELSGEVALFELDVAELAKSSKLMPAFQSLPKYPAVFRDIAVVVNSDLSSDAVRSIILQVGGKIVEDVTVFDVYTGRPIPEGRKNLAFAITYRAPDRTLTDEEVNAAHGRIISEVNSKVGGSLRGVDT